MLKIKSLLKQKRKKLLTLEDAVKKLNKKNIKKGAKYKVKWQECTGEKFEEDVYAIEDLKFELYKNCKMSEIVKVGCLLCGYALGKFCFYTYINTRYYDKSGKLHRENGPALDYWNGRKEWFLNGVRHRIDGPALYFEGFDGNYNEWWINGVRLSPEKVKLIKLWLENKS